MTRTLLVATVLTLGTALSAHAGCKNHGQQVMSCAEGSTWDTATQACIPVASS